MPPTTPDNKESSRLWRLSGMGTELAFGVIGMALLGFLLDRWLKTTPWIMLAGAVLGVIGGGYNFIRRALAENKAATEQWRQDHPGGMAAIKAAKRAKNKRGGGGGSAEPRKPPQRSRAVSDESDDPYR